MLIWQAIPLPPDLHVPQVGSLMMCSVCGSRTIETKPEQYPGGIEAMRRGPSLSPVSFLGVRHLRGNSLIKILFKPHLSHGRTLETVRHVRQICSPSQT